jgi:hypothetical protein
LELVHIIQKNELYINKNDIEHGLTNNIIPGPETKERP